ncbi:MAG: exo-beta-N-acetylmuramidase NamZ family protein [Lentisphaeria bacterium]
MLKRILFATLFSAISFANVKPGIEVFLEKYTHLVKGERIGLITNATGVNSKFIPTIDLLHQNKNVDLKLLMAPEHGIRGDVHAGDHFKDMKDEKTNLNIYSLYGGKNHRPPQIALDQIDTIIYDIQDIGGRAYTYIWHLAEAMAAAGLNNKKVIVLDRPNPLGAETFDGYISETKWLSFIGLHPIPRSYGMTVGELARLLNQEYNLNCHLTIIPMQNYKRSMTWQETKLPWIPPSPHIPTVDSALCFSATGAIGTLGNVNIGVGYTIAFCSIATEWIDPDKTATILNELKLPGIYFRPIHYKPFYGGMSGKAIKGVQLHVTDPVIFQPARTELTILHHLINHYPNNFSFPPDKNDAFDKAVGTSYIREALIAKKPLSEILQKVQIQLNEFAAKRKKYLIY